MFPNIKLIQLLYCNCTDYSCSVEGFLTNIHMCGVGSFHQETLESSVELGLSAAEKLDEELLIALKLEEERFGKYGKKEIFGFLR